MTNTSKCGIYPRQISHLFRLNADWLMCLKMTFDEGKCGSDVIFDFILGEYVVGIVWITFVFKIIQVLFAVFGVTCSKVFNLSKLVFGFTFIFYFTCRMIASLEAWNSKEQLNVFIYAWWVANLKDNSNRNSTHKCSRLKNVLLKLLHCFTILCFEILDFPKVL